MNQKIKFNNPTEFLEYNSKRLSEQYFEHYHLNSLFESLKNGEGKLFDVYNIVGDDETDILAVWADISYYLYATKWNDEAVKIVAESIDNENFDIVVLRGQKDLINEVIKLKNLKTRLINDRIIYDCEIINKPNSKNGELIVATEKNFADILKLNLGYYHEDFNGQGTQTDEEISRSVQMGILERTIFAWKVANKMTSSLRIINHNPQNVMIGALFTSKEHRKKGFASELLQSATSEILKSGVEKCGLLTERENIGSNNAVKSANYIKKFEWINVQIIE
ncbi:GNAT family N-acetyltransferase [Dokdonia ponticola]|uniref:GNAT family N-acetyltransferase n=1 Tax=Dokdonia ponticola TaxID=2041041 RepID=A0ABV9HQX3_9FLAO